MEECEGGRESGGVAIDGSRLGPHQCSRSSRRTDFPQTGDRLPTAHRHIHSPHHVITMLCRLLKVCVVWTGQVVPVWLYGHTLVRVRVIETRVTGESMGCCRLGLDSELAVQPVKHSNGALCERVRVCLWTTERNHERARVRKSGGANG